MQFCLPLLSQMFILNFFMKIFKIRMWIFSKEEQKVLNQFKEQEVAKDEISLFNILNVLGNLLPLIIAFVMSILLFDMRDSAIENSKDIGLNPSSIIRLLNNGSLPLISYSIILSTIIFLLDKTDPNHEGLRKKLLGISVLLLFISISLYTMLTSLSMLISLEGHWFLWLVSVTLFSFTINVSKFMILLQKKVVDSYNDTINNAREKISGVDDNFEQNDIIFVEK